MRVNNLGRLPLWGKPTDMLDMLFFREIEQ